MSAVCKLCVCFSLFLIQPRAVHFDLTQTQELFSVGNDNINIAAFRSIACELSNNISSDACDHSTPIRGNRNLIC